MTRVLQAATWNFEKGQNRSKKTFLGLKMIIFGHFSSFLASFKISFSSLQHPNYDPDGSGLKIKNLNPTLKAFKLNYCRLQLVIFPIRRCSASFWVSRRCRKRSTQAHSSLLSKFRKNNYKNNFFWNFIKLKFGMFPEGVWSDRIDFVESLFLFIFWKSIFVLDFGVWFRWEAVLH